MTNTVTLIPFLLFFTKNCVSGSGSSYQRPNETKNIRSACSSRTIVTQIPRCGGNSPIQPNPSYVDFNTYMSPSLGDDIYDNTNHIRRPFSYQNDHFQRYNHNSPQQQGQQRTLKPLQQVIQEFMKKLYVSSPTIFYGIVSSAIVFITWQIPPFTSILQRHFVCNRHNILHNHRYHTLLSSAVSHNSVTHLLMNLYGFFVFGKNVEHILRINNLSLSAYCVASAIISNLFFMYLTPNGSCIGLSGVSLSLLALDAKLNPSKELQFLLRFVPIRLPAQYALIGLFVWSLLGVLNSTLGGKHDGVAHSVHLGGLVYGVAVYELLKRGIYRKYVQIGKRLLFDWKRKFGPQPRRR